MEDEEEEEEIEGVNEKRTKEGMGEEEEAEMEGVKKKRKMREWKKKKWNV